MNKNYLDHPFKVGDVVYHYHQGRGIVIDVLYLNDFGVNVLFDGGINATFTNLGILQLSFTPYEINTNWERPKEPEYIPRRGDFVRFRTAFSSIYMEGIFDSEDEVKGYWFYATTPIKEDTSLSYNIWESEDDIELMPSDGTTIFRALKEVGKRWDSNTQYFENASILKKGDFISSKKGKYIFILDKIGDRGELYHKALLVNGKLELGDGKKYVGYYKNVDNAYASLQEKITIINKLEAAKLVWNSETCDLEELSYNTLKRLKIGDRVIIRNGISSETHNIGKPYYDGLSFTKEMDEFIGQLLTVTHVRIDGNLQANGGYFLRPNWVLKI